MSDETNNTSSGDAGYEKEDVNLRSVMIVGLSVVAIVIFFSVVLYDYFISYKEEQVYLKILQPESTVLRDLRAREDEALNSYKLLDVQNGVYRIPISRAKELLAEEAYQQRLRDAQRK